MSGRSNRSLAERDLAHVLHGYTNLAALAERPPLPIVGGHGVYVTDEHGRDYLEGAAGMWCATLGFSEGELAKAAAEQFAKLPYYHTFVDKTLAPVVELSEMLCALAPAPLTRVYLCNSGSEANDTIVKLVRYYNNARGRPKKKKIVSRWGGFHGVTLAAASLCGIPAIHAEFDLPLPGFVKTACPHYYRYGAAGESEEAFSRRLAAELDALIRAEGPETVAAFIAEPVMGAGGAIVPPKGYFEHVQAVLKKHDVLMIADEVITGFGRTGNLFGSETYAIRPDMMSLAKGLSSAYQPIAAVLVSDQIYAAMVEQSRSVGAFFHAFTTGGHPVAAAVAKRTLELYAERDILGHVRRVAPLFQERLKSFAAHPLVGEADGVGLIGAIELVADKANKTPFAAALNVKERLRRACQEEGLLIRAVPAGDRIAFSPPLIITEAEIDELFRRFATALERIAGMLAADGGLV